LKLNNVDLPLRTLSLCPELGLPAASDGGEAAIRDA